MRFYATGTFQDVVGELIGVSQVTASCTITRVTDVLVRHVSEWVKMPTKRGRHHKTEVILQCKAYPVSLGLDKMDLGFADLIGCRTLSLAPNLVFVTQTSFLIFR